MRLSATTADETEAFGGRLALAMPAAGPTALQIQLQGDLGAGKTTLARGFLRALGHVGAVRSPTYTFIETYALGAATVVHVDLYRLQDPAEVEGLGLRDLSTAGHVWLVEWPQRALHWLPVPDLVVSLAALPTFHEIGLEATSPVGTQWLRTVKG